MESPKQFNGILIREDIVNALKPYKIGEYKIVRCYGPGSWLETHVIFNLKWWQMRKRIKVKRAFEQLSPRFCVGIIPIYFYDQDFNQ